MLKNSVRAVYIKAYLVFIVIYFPTVLNMHQRDKNRDNTSDFKSIASAILTFKISGTL